MYDGHRRQLAGRFRIESLSVLVEAQTPQRIFATLRFCTGLDSVGI
jgi:hypothetical protein